MTRVYVVMRGYDYSESEALAVFFDEASAERLIRRLESQQTKSPPDAFWFEIVPLNPED